MGPGVRERKVSGITAKFWACGTGWVVVPCNEIGNNRRTCLGRKVRGSAWDV